MLYEKFILILCYLKLHVWFTLLIGIVFIHYQRIGSVWLANNPTRCTTCGLIFPHTYAY